MGQLPDNSFCNKIVDIFDLEIEKTRDITYKEELVAMFYRSMLPVIVEKWVSFDTEYSSDSDNYESESPSFLSFTNLSRPESKEAVSLNSRLCSTRCKLFPKNRLRQSIKLKRLRTSRHSKILSKTSSKVQSTSSDVNIFY